ncbi:MAG TPA: type 1 fimbrial protein [Morganella sp. (in: Bacteria)]|nr:type 1 fimbrial protein [Morganella sp. (in: enterobacteria)]
MFNFKIKLIVSALIMFSSNVFADDVHEIKPEAQGPVSVSGNINFKGSITDSSCDITKNQDVELGTHSVTVLKERGQTTAEVDFNIDIKDCSVSMNSLAITISGEPHQDNNTIFALNADEQSAGKVGIALKTKEGDVVNPTGDKRVIEPRTDTRDYSLGYVVNYMATGLATPGTANATVNYTVTYN